MEKLTELYDASAQDLRFGIGVMVGADDEQLPVISIYYATWPKEMLEVVRESMRCGITLDRVQRRDGLVDLILATRERSEVHARDHQQTEVIRFPSWDTRLEGIESNVVEHFDRGRQLLERFLLIVQTDRWMFESVVTMDGTIKMSHLQAASIRIPYES